MKRIAKLIVLLLMAAPALAQESTKPKSSVPEKSDLERAGCFLRVVTYTGAERIHEEFKVNDVSDMRFVDPYTSINPNHVASFKSEKYKIFATVFVGIRKSTRYASGSIMGFQVGSNYGWRVHTGFVNLDISPTSNDDKFVKLVETPIKSSKGISRVAEIVCALE